MSEVSRLGGFSIRSSGRDLRAVRRPGQGLAVKPATAPVLTELKKAQLVALAESQGVDTSGTKADLVDRLGAPESNDATVRPDVPNE